MPRKGSGERLAFRRVDEAAGLLEPVDPERDLEHVLAVSAARVACSGLLLWACNHSFVVVALLMWLMLIVFIALCADAQLL